MHEGKVTVYILQSKDNDAERFLEKLKARMDRYIAFPTCNTAPHTGLTGYALNELCCIKADQLST